jgi:hypothetical protein
VTEKSAARRPDVRAELDEWSAYVDGYKAARQNEADWKVVKETFQQHLINKLTAVGANVGTVSTVDAIRITEYVQDVFHKDKFRAEYPELLEEFTTQSDRVRFTAK